MEDLLTAIGSFIEEREWDQFHSPKNPVMALSVEVAEIVEHFQRLLVQRKAATWLQMHYFETLYAQNMDEMTIPQDEFHQKRIDRDHRRHLSAHKTLAQIRKIGPAVQINVAE